MKPETMMIDDVLYVRADSVKKPKGKEVLIRTYSAGVHVGILDEEWEGEWKSITLKNARRIYRWRGANTLNEISTDGVNREEYTKISKEIESIELVPIEIIPVCEGVDLSEVWNV